MERKWKFLENRIKITTDYAFTPLSQLRNNTVFSLNVKQETRPTSLLELRNTQLSCVRSACVTLCYKANSNAKSRSKYPRLSDELYKTTKMAEDAARTFLHITYWLSSLGSPLLMLER
jgi:hypothetical protein